MIRVRLFTSSLSTCQKLMMFIAVSRVRFMLITCAFRFFWTFTKFLKLVAGKNGPETSIFSCL